MSSSPAPRAHTVRSLSGLVTSGLAAAVAVFLLGDAVIRGSWDVFIQYAPWLLLIVWGIYVGIGASVIRWDDAALTAQNFLRRHRVPWARITGVDIRYQVRLETDQGSEIALIGGPAAGRPPRPVRPGTPRSEPPIVRLRDDVEAAWEAHREDAAADAPIMRTWDWLLIGVFVILAVWAIATLVF